MPKISIFLFSRNFFDHFLYIIDHSSIKINYKTILDACNFAIKWLDMNQQAEQEEYEYKLKEIERVCKPLISKMYGNDGTSQNNETKQGPTIVELD